MQNPRPPGKEKIIALVGPTASGKTALAIRLVQYLSNHPRITSNESRINENYSGTIRHHSRNIREYAAEIVSADSRQIYRDMDIGTAKPKLTKIANQSRMKIANNLESHGRHSRRLEILFETDSRIPHHLIDIKNPNEPYTVAEYKRDALRSIRSVLKRGNVPILVGGTGLYVKAVTDNLNIPKIKANPVMRKNIELRIMKYGLKSVFNELVRLDPEAAYVVDPKNPRRVVRALEVAIMTGKPFTSQRTKREPLFDVLKIGIAVPSEKLRTRINERVDEMVRDGLVDEVQRLVKKYGANCPAFDAIGYREIIAHLNAETTLGEAVEAIKRHTWHFAKRQMTWFRKDAGIRWIHTNAEAQKVLMRFLGPPGGARKTNRKEKWAG